MRMAPLQASLWSRAKHRLGARDTLYERQERISLRTLDSLDFAVTSPTMLKIDTQGYEDHVIDRGSVLGFDLIDIDPFVRDHATVEGLSIGAIRVRNHYEPIRQGG
jgi:hypothetical protein